MTTQLFSTDDQDLHEILQSVANDKHVILVPDFQRDYEWSVDKQVAWLWSDILRVYHRRRAGDLKAEHFVGTLLTGKLRRVGGLWGQPVIDGQQRLITLALLIAAIRDQANGDAVSVNASRLLGPSGANGQMKNPRLVVRPTNRPAFDAIMRGEANQFGRSSVDRVYRFFHDALLLSAEQIEVDSSDSVYATYPDTESDVFAHVSGDEYGADAGRDKSESDGPLLGEGRPADTGTSIDLELLLSCVAHGLRFVRIQDLDSSMYFEVFEALNHKGLPLSQASLIRNGIAMRCADSPNSSWVAQWQALRSELGVDDDTRVEAFFHTHVIRVGRNVPRKQTYVELMTLLDKAVRAGGSVEVAVNSLFQEGAVFSDLVTGKLDPSTQFLVQWGAAPVWPLLLDAAVRQRSNQLSLQDFRKIVRAAESLLVRRFICGVPPNDLRSAIGRLMSRLSSAHVTSDAYTNTVIGELREPALRWPSDDDIRTSFMQTALYRDGKSGYAGLVLLGLAEQLGGKEVSAVMKIGRKKTDYSVEHIYPQDGAKWRADLKSWGMRSADMKKRLHLIGNLTLTTYNSEFSNLAFSDKKSKVSGKDLIALSSGVWDAAEWGVVQIDERGKRLTSAALKRWPRPK